MHHGITWGKEYWPIALIVIAAIFAIPEVYALFTNFSNTLSDYARYQLGINNLQVPLDKHTIAWFATLILWLPIVVWLTYHIWFERGLQI